MSNIKPQPCIKLEGVSKVYTLQGGKPSLLSRITPRHSNKHYALRDIDLTVYPGERIGIIGSNGSGKSTLLKVIAGIITPTTGQMDVKGHVLSLISLTAGFNPVLTGIDNIKLQASLLEYKPSEIKRKLTAIIRYADIGTYIDQPIHTYSSGMMLRLAFSIIIHLDADIYLFDEFLSVGDVDFQRKTRASIDKLVELKKTILITNQNFSSILSFCSHIITIDQGRIPKQPPISKRIIDFYQSSVKQFSTSTIVISDSMAPTFKKGDTVTFARCNFEEIKPNDIIVFCFPNYPQLITHRVLGVVTTTNGFGLVTKGDGNVVMDNWLITQQEYVGKVTSHR
jgi:ABC-type polysaccharide/polyol phosphate transport system ATPase subunit